MTTPLLDLLYCTNHWNKVLLMSVTNSVHLSYIFTEVLWDSCVFKPLCKSTPQWAHPGSSSCPLILNPVHSWTEPWGTILHGENLQHKLMFTNVLKVAVRVQYLRQKHSTITSSLLGLLSSELQVQFNTPIPRPQTKRQFSASNWLITTYVYNFRLSSIVTVIIKNLIITEICNSRVFIGLVIMGYEPLHVRVIFWTFHSRLLDMRCYS